MAMGENGPKRKWLNEKGSNDKLTNGKAGPLNKTAKLYFHDHKVSNKSIISQKLIVYPTSLLETAILTYQESLSYP